MNEYAPDYWQVIRIVTPTETIYKLFSSWVGGYANGDSWRLNSGITGIKKVEKVFQMTHGPKTLPIAYEITGHSGSVYTVPARENCYRTTAYTGNILQSMIDKVENEIEYEIQVLPFDTDWEKLV